MALVPVATWHRINGADRRRGRDPLSERSLLIPGTYQPGPSTTGVLPGTVLTTYAPGGATPELFLNEAYIAANGGRSQDGRFYLMNLDIHGELDIRANNVTVRNCFIRGYANAYGTELSIIRAYNGYSGLIIEDCTIDPGVDARVGQDGYHVIGATVRRCDISHTVDGGKIRGIACVVEANWVHDLEYYLEDPQQTDGSHNDGVQVQSGGPHIIRGNYFNTPLQNTASIMVTQDAGTITAPLTIDRNWLTGGTVSLNLAEKGKGPIVAAITDNVFGGSATGWDIILPDTTRNVSTLSGNIRTDGDPAVIRRG